MMMMVNLKDGDLIQSPSDFTLEGSANVGVGGGTVYHYGVTALTYTVNGTSELAGESAIGNTFYHPADAGTYARIMFTPENTSGSYLIYKGTAAAGTNGTFLHPYKIMDGTTGTHLDINVNDLGTAGIFPPTNSLSYTQAVNIAQPAGYSAPFYTDKVSHRLQNEQLRTYDKGDYYTAALNFDRITDEELNDLMTVFNWKTDIRFFPNKESTSLYFDVQWSNNFDFTFAVPTIPSSGWTGVMSLSGISRASGIGRVY